MQGNLELAVDILQVQVFVFFVRIVYFVHFSALSVSFLAEFLPVAV